MKRFLASALLVCLLFTVLPCSVSAKRRLTDADYLAFSAISVFNFFEGETVRQALERLSVWNTNWDDTQSITYAQLCKHIASYRVVRFFDQSMQNGFYAVLFADEHADGVLAFRSSAPPLSQGTDGIDAMHDWLKNDLPMELGNRMGSQYESVLQTYRIAETVCSEITVTGHSLGGAWADIVSVLYGCRGVSFNAVSVLDVLYRHDPERASTLFAGVDAWNFVDHANEYDILAGMFETYAATEIKPYIAHKSNIKVDTQALSTIQNALSHADIADFASGILNLFSDEIILCHSLQSFVMTDPAGNVCLTEEVSRFEGCTEITGEMATAGCFVELGHSGANRLAEGLLSLAPGTIYGGDGDDMLTGSISADVLIGGNGNDTLDGSWGDDTYFYRSGDGVDLLADAAGNDTLLLYGTKNGTFSASISDDGLYVDIRMDQTPAVRILRASRSADAGVFLVTYNEQTQDISSLFNGLPFSSRIVINSDVQVWIVDSLGKLIDTADCTKKTAYGNVYLAKDHSRVFDLRAGYTVKWIGTGEKTVELRYQAAHNGMLSHTQVLSGITVGNRYFATLTRDSAGDLFIRIETENFLRGDVNLDNAVDARDYLMLKRYILQTYTLTPAQTDASDFNGDGKTDVKDYLMLKRCILGTYSI